MGYVMIAGIDHESPDAPDISIGGVHVLTPAHLDLADRHAVERHLLCVSRSSVVADLRLRHTSHRADARYSEPVVGQRQNILIGIAEVFGRPTDQLRLVSLFEHLELSDRAFQPNQGSCRGHEIDWHEPALALLVRRLDDQVRDRPRHGIDHHAPQLAADAVVARDLAADEELVGLTHARQRTRHAATTTFAASVLIERTVANEMAFTSAPAPAASAARLGTEPAFSVLARAKELERLGRSIVHLEIGEPDFPTPAHVVEAAVDALRRGETHYTPSAGLPEFREAIATDFIRSRAINVSPDRVLISNGAKPLLFFTVLAVCDPGDEVIYPDPGFPIYESAIRWAGGVPVPLPLRDELDFGFALEDLSERLSARTKLVILNSPNNPTGGVTPAADLRAACELILSTSAWVLSDEVYRRIVYDTDVASVAGMPEMLERCVLLDGLSKTYAMTGWRCGYAAVPEPLVEPLTRFVVNSVSCVPAFVQLAGVAALTGPQEAVASMVAEFHARRDLLVSGLNALPGVSCRVPQGAFYAFPDVSGVPLATPDLADQLLEKSGVAVLAGNGFGAGGADHLRISYANSRDRLELALERMEKFLLAVGG